MTKKNPYDGVLAPDKDEVERLKDRLQDQLEEEAAEASRKRARRDSAELPAVDSEDEQEEPEPSGLPGVMRGFWHWLLANPYRLITMSFAFVILVGSLLLNLPFASESGEAIGYLKALFTSTSATCVTGLIVADTAIQWTSFGELVILLLIQIGGLGLVTIMSIFLMMGKRRMGLKTMLAVQESTGADDFVSAGTLARRILAITFITEFVGGAIVSWRFSLRMPLEEALRRGFFHGISAYCNAGFDLMGRYSGPYSSMTAFNDDPIVLLTTAVLLIFGGLGFVVWNDLIFRRRTDHPADRGKLGRRLFYPLRYHSRLVLSITALLLLSGTLLFFVLEGGNTQAQALGSLPAQQRPAAAFFQAATLRTAGFNTIDQSSLTPASKFIGVMFMFIGAAPAGTGGGIKLTTFSIVIATVIAYLRGREQTVLMKRTVERQTFMKAMVIMLLGFTIEILASLGLAIAELPAPQAGEYAFVDLVYEVTSAFATVGVTSTPTNQLQPASWMILIACMYLGRVGPASFAMGLTFRQQREEKIYPEGKTYVG